MDVRRRLEVLHTQLESCTACPAMHGPPVHGPPVVTPIVLVGQAPGPREGALGRPFAWTAGKTLFRWFHGATGVDEHGFRAGVYITAVARCFPGKASGGGDRRPDPGEIARCQRFLSGEVAALRPQLVIPVGGLAIEQVLGHKGPLVDVIGSQRRVTLHGVDTDVICLPHPSGASTWHRVEPGISLLAVALARIAAHPAFVATFGAHAPHTISAPAKPELRPTTATRTTTPAKPASDARTTPTKSDARTSPTKKPEPASDARTTPAKSDARTSPTKKTELASDARTTPAKSDARTSPTKKTEPDLDARTTPAKSAARTAPTKKPEPDARPPSPAKPAIDARTTTPAKPDPRPRTTRRARRPDPREAQP